MEPVQLIAIIVSLAFTVVGVVFTARAVKAMLDVIRIGQPTSRSDNPAARAVNMLKETFGHTRMLQVTWVGILHWFAFAAFLFLSSAVAAGFVQLFDPMFEIPVVGKWYLYGWTAEILGFLGTLGIIPLTIYRLTHRPSELGRKSRFFGSTMWQAYFVEFMVLLESAAILFIRGAEYKLHHATALHFPLSHLVGEWFYPDGEGALKNIVWIVAMIKVSSAMIWLIVISNFLTMGIAWHRFTAWFNIFFKRESSGATALGAMKPMTSNGEIVNFEDLEDMDEDTTLGVGAIEDFSWKGILDFTTCTECGRCQSQCPAWNTEKPLSPKLMIMGLREHAYAKAPYVEAGGEGSEAATALLEKDPKVADAVGRSLVGKGAEDDWFYNPEGGDFVIDADALWSCTSCGACVQQCPVDIEHVDHFMDMRRYQILVESNFPAELNGLFKGLENKGNPWNMNPKGRMEWAAGLDFEVPVVGEDAESMDEFDWLFWVGCAGAYEDRAKKTTRAVAELLNMADVKFAVLGNGETCTGDPARRAGNEFVFQGLATQNAETFKEMKVKKVVSTCAHCFNTLKNEYKEFGVELEVVHHTQLLNRLVREKKLTPVASQGAKRSITYHDPCYLGRHNQVYSPPRELLQVIPEAEVKEMPRNSEKSFCCGAGGARMWMEETIGERININRTKEAVETGADQIAVGCPFCRVMLSDGLTAQQSNGEAREEVEVLDVAQLLLASVKGESYAPKKSTPAPAAKKTAQPAPPAEKADQPAPPAEKADQPAPPAEKADQPAPSVEVADEGGPRNQETPGGSLFDATPSAEKAGEPAPSVEVADEGGQRNQETPGGSLFDIEAPAEPAPTKQTDDPTPPTEETDDPTPSVEVADEGGPRNQEPTTAEPATDIGTGSLFDIEAPAEPAPTKQTDDPTPSVEVADEGGPRNQEPLNNPAEDSTDTPITSLHDIKAKHESPSGPADTDETEAEPDPSPEEPDEQATNKPASTSSGEAHQPATDKDVNAANSLFDL